MKDFSSQLKLSSGISSFSRGGRTAEVSRRLNSSFLRYVLSCGCQVLYSTSSTPSRFCHLGFSPEAAGFPSRYEVSPAGTFSLRREVLPVGVSSSRFEVPCVPGFSSRSEPSPAGPFLSRSEISSGEGLAPPLICDSYRFSASRKASAVR